MTISEMAITNFTTAPTSQVKSVQLPKQNQSKFPNRRKKIPCKSNDLQGENLILKNFINP